jgi:hypothetical protein
MSFHAAEVPTRKRGTEERGTAEAHLKSSSFVCSSTKRGTEEKGRGRESGYSQVQKNLTIKK